MIATNSNQPGVHIQSWAWTKFLPLTTTATSCMASGDVVGERFTYYLNGSTFYRYDNFTDMYQQLASPITGSTTGSVMRYSSYAGYRGNCLGATSTTIDIPGLELQTLKGKKIRITSGTGEGQDRTITDISEPILLDQGMVTAASANDLTDTTKRWEINQYIGCQVRLVYGTGQSQVRKILYNDANKLYFYDVNYQQLDLIRQTQLATIKGLADLIKGDTTKEEDIKTIKALKFPDSSEVVPPANVIVFVKYAPIPAAASIT